MLLHCELWLQLRIFAPPWQPSTHLPLCLAFAPDGHVWAMIEICYACSTLCACQLCSSAHPPRRIQALQCLMSSVACCYVGQLERLEGFLENALPILKRELFHFLAFQQACNPLSDCSWQHSIATCIAMCKQRYMPRTRCFRSASILYKYELTGK